MGVQEAFVFGSWAARYMGEPGAAPRDIDVVVIGDAPLATVRRATSPFDEASRATAFPEIDFRREVTIGHLLVDIDSAPGIGGTVNPPIRPRADVEALWAHLIDGQVDWVSSDHACCREETKYGQPSDDVFLAKSGFGGAEYLLPGLVSEGRRRGRGLDRIARLTAWEPGQRFGLGSKGAIA